MAEMGMSGIGDGRMKYAVRKFKGKMKAKAQSRRIGRMQKQDMREEKRANRPSLVASPQERQVRQDMRQENRMKRQAERGQNRAYRKDAREVRRETPMKEKFKAVAKKVKTKYEDIRSEAQKRRVERGFGRPKGMKANCSGTACEDLGNG
jgi:hypothetical protein